MYMAQAPQQVVPRPCVMTAGLVYSEEQEMRTQGQWAAGVKALAKARQKMGDWV